MSWVKRIKIALLAFLLLISSAEIGTRLLGLTNFPIYSIDSEIGYIPQPSQAGIFLNKNDWVFNDKSMGVDKNWNPQGRFNILLIGNSIIMGGNPYPQKDKIAPLVQKQLKEGQMLWPIATGGWTNVNETNYLQKNPDVAQAAQFFVWEYMSGGLSQLSQWRGDYVFPSAQPVSASWYALRRYVLPKVFEFNMNELPPVGITDATHRINFEKQLSILSKATGRTNPGILLLYPTQNELELARRGQDWLPERLMLEAIASQYGLIVIDVAKSREWESNLYRDGVHPTVDGNVVLANIIAQSIHLELQ